ncbi:hypothetical protein OPQ81_005030 [Rhizoctonia solani]|nr:hypothetical protein OPQ81_005030 [Rhizoctonia solani]
MGPPTHTHERLLSSTPRPQRPMMVRPGQHVDPQGQVYHPYLVGWADYWDKSNIRDFLVILQDIFAKEPPVIARGQAQQSRPPPPPHAQQQATPTPPPVPPLPQELSARPSSSIHSSPCAQRSTTCSRLRSPIKNLHEQVAHLHYLLHRPV